MRSDSLCYETNCFTMATFIIKQPNGKYALFDSCEDRFILADCVLEHLIEEARSTAADAAEASTRSHFADVEAGRVPFFSPTWEEACELHNLTDAEPINPADYDP